MTRIYFVSYPAEMTPEDRNALRSRRNFKLYENGYGVSEAWYGPRDRGPTNITTYQVVRLEAESEEDARQQVVDALGREPEDLRATPGRE